MEQSLHSGVATLITSELPEVSSLTQLGRLKLAAKNNPQNSKLYIHVGIILNDRKKIIPTICSRWYVNPLPFWNKCTDKKLTFLKESGTMKDRLSKISSPKKWILESVQSNEYSYFKDLI